MAAGSYEAEIGGRFFAQILAQIWLNFEDFMIHVGAKPRQMIFWQNSARKSEPRRVDAGSAPPFFLTFSDFWGPGPVRPLC